MIRTEQSPSRSLSSTPPPKMNCSSRSATPKTPPPFKYASNILLLVLIDIVVSLITLSIVYLLLKQTFQLLGFLAWNAFSYMILFVGTFALKGLGVMVDVKEELIFARQSLEDEQSSFSFDDEEDENSKKEEGELKDE